MKGYISIYCCFRLYNSNEIARSLQLKVRAFTSNKVRWINGSNAVYTTATKYRSRNRSIDMRPPWKAHEALRGSRPPARETSFSGINLCSLLRLYECDRRRNFSSRSKSCVSERPLCDCTLWQTLCHVYVQETWDKHEWHPEDFWCVACMWVYLEI